MKNNIISSIVALSLLYGCQNDSLDQHLDNQFNNDLTKSALTRSWVDCKDVLLPSGNEVNAPWDKNATTVIPKHIREDVNPIDGWKLLDSTVEFIGYDNNLNPEVDDGANYILFYNIYTGFLKGFYYAETIQKNGGGVWQLKIDGKTKLFNFLGKDAIPFDQYGPNQIEVMNVTTDGSTQGFTIGWNCFNIELAYDPTSDKQRININGIAYEKTEFDISGAFTSKSTGSILISAPVKPGIREWVASGTGDAGKEWIVEQIGGVNNKD